MSKLTMKLSWQCHICKASFFRENLLQMHHDNFHTDLPVHSLAGKKFTTNITSTKETGTVTERTFENNIYCIKTIEVSEIYKKNSLTGSSTDKRECVIKEDCSVKEIKDGSEKEVKEIVKLEPESEKCEQGLQGASDDDMAVVVVRKDGSMFIVTDTYFEEQGSNQMSDSLKFADESNEDITSDTQLVTDEDMSLQRFSSENMSDQHTHSKVLSEKIMKVREQIEEKRIKPQNLTIEQQSYGQRLSFQCKRCDQVFPTKHERRLHLETHSKDLRFFCKDCGRGFRKSASLILHSNVHIEGSHHQCPHCHKYYRTAIYLKKHIKLHDPSQHIHQCPSCPKRFAFPEWLRYHMRTHTKEAPYVCTICGKRYQQAQGLQYHMLMHEGKKPHHCSYCGKFFLQRSTLVTHMRHHNQEKQMPCSCVQPGFNEEKISREPIQHHELCPKKQPPPHERCRSTAYANA